MRRTLFKNHKNHYNVQDEPLVISKALMDTLLKQNNPADCISLYMFYYYTAKWQQTNQPKATISYVAEGLNWSDTRVRKIKKQLIYLRLVKDVTSKHPTNNKITGHYIKINFIWRNNHPLSNPEGVDLYSMEKEEGNALSSNNINALSSNTSITPKRFDDFWRIYPKKTSQGKASTAWKKICNRPSEQRPSWKTIKLAILAQKKTPQWSDRKYIANPSTWLNQSRWLDDPNEMILYNRDDKPERIMDNGEWYYLDDKGRYKNRNDEYYINE